MGSVRIEGGDELHSPEKVLVDESGSVNYALIPRKNRSAIKKRVRVAIDLPWSSPRKKRRVPKESEKARPKKSKLTKKKKEEIISKDEQEVIETLNSLAQLFSDAENTTKPKPDDGPSNIESSTEDSATLNVQEEPATKHGKHRYTKEEKGKGLLVSPSLSTTKFISSETRGAIVRSSVFPKWLENATSVVEQNSFLDKFQYPQNMLEPKDAWKRCSGHVGIAHLIKSTEVSKGFTPTPTQLSICGGIDQMRRTNGLTDDQTSLTLSSFKQGPDFLSMGGRGFLVDTRERVNISEYSREALKQFHRSNQPKRSHPITTSTFHGRTSAEEALQAKLSTSLELQRWYSPHGGLILPHLPERPSWGRVPTSFVNDAEARFPHLNSASGPMYQLAPPHLSYMPWMSSPWPLQNTAIQPHRLNPAVDRNGDALHS